ncbi:MAG: SCP-2 sterol transfer family protein [Lachnospiraceae bacterium]|nr:SCP-2 sterol transfer family protein [Lachnospiraceae bacterium]
MKVGIYYGGRGVIEDPTLYVLEIIEQVLDELNVSVNRYNLYEHRAGLSRLTQTIRDRDGVIFATTVEWLGIGGYMTQFLDELWLYGDREKMASMYMQPVVLSTTYGEREGMLNLEHAWESLGGIPTNGLCGYVGDIDSFRENAKYREYIEKKAEELYKTIGKRMTGLPTSSQAVTQTVQRARQMHLTPQESDQLSEWVADESKVAKQKEDVQELSEIYKRLIGGVDRASGPSEEFVEDFKRAFTGTPEVSRTFLFHIAGKEQPLLISVNGRQMSGRYQSVGAGDLECSLSSSILETITEGRMTFQRAFSVGDMSAKGDFGTLRLLDELFVFSV